MKAAALCGNSAPWLCCNFLQYGKYCCETAPRQYAKFTRKSLLSHDAVLPLLRRELQPHDAHQQQGKEDQPGRRHRLLKGDDAHEHRAQRAAALSRHSRFMPG